MSSNVKMQTKIILSFSVLVIFIILVFGLFLNFYIFNNIETGIKHDTQQLAIKISQQVASYLKEINQVSKNIIINKDIQDTLSQINARKGSIDTNVGLLYSRKFDDIMNDIIPITSIPLSHIYIYSKNTDYNYSYIPYVSNFKSIRKNKDYISKLQDRDWIIYANNINNFNYTGANSFSLFRSVIDINKNVYGFIEVQESYDELSSICNIGSDSQVYILNGDGNYVYPYSIVDQSQKDFINSINLNSTGLLKDKYGNIYSFAKSSNTGFTVIIKHSPNTILAPLYFIQHITLGIILVVTFFSLFMIYFISRFLVSPVRKLRDSIVTIGINNMNLDFNGKIYNNEINLLNIAFQDMLDRFKASMERELAANQEESKARFTALQAQIAPHFIHNVLYVISAFSQENKPDVVVRMCKQLSDMLRYVVSSPFSIVTLEDEIEYTRNYLSLQQQNYEDFLFYTIDLEDNIKGLKLPRLVIQPFVENAIHHGFKSRRPPWHINIRCIVKNDTWTILVEDNGSGIPEERLTEIKNKISVLDIDLFTKKEKQSFGMGSMGIVNTFMRIQLMYKDNLTFNIESNKFGGTTVLIQGKLNIDVEETIN